MAISFPSTVAATDFNPKQNALPPRSAPHRPAPVQIRHKRFPPYGLPPIYSVLALSWRMLRTEPVTVLCILISIPLVPRSYRPNANYNPTKRYLPSPPDAFTYSKKWPVLIRPTTSGG